MRDQRKPGAVATAALTLFLAALLGGCIGSSPAFHVPELPSDFVALYRDGNGNELSFRSETKTSLDRHGRLGPVLILDAGGTKFGFDACGPPAWHGNGLDSGDRMQLNRWRWDDKWWWAFQGETIVANQTVAPLEGGFSSGSRTFRYTQHPVPTWIEDSRGGPKWDLVSYEGPSSGSCKTAAQGSRVPYGADGPSTMPDFPYRSMASVLEYLRGPLGPAEFKEWSEDHPEAWVYTFQYTPPLIDPFPEPLGRRDWIIRIAGGDGTGMEIFCILDASDRFVPADQKPFNCSVGNEPTDARAPPLPIADPQAAEATFRALGMEPTDMFGGSNSTASGLEMAAWHKTTNASGYEVQRYGIAWDAEGRLRLASLPADLGLI